MRSGYNNALVQAVAWTGPPTRLSWELQHRLCAAAGRATPGSSSTRSRDHQNKYCAYSPTDNHVVTDDCNWAGEREGYGPTWTRVSGSLGGGVGYMCAHQHCNIAVRVEGTTASEHREYPSEIGPAFESGDAVFCSA